MSGLPSNQPVRSLSASRYALPDGGRTQSATYQSLSAALATPAQIQAAPPVEMAAANPGKQLALVNEQKLQEEIRLYAKQYEHQVNDTVINMRSILMSIRQSYRKQGPEGAAGVESVEHLWEELDRLHERAVAAHKPLTKFMDQQKDNFNLLHRSVVHEKMKEAQVELSSHKEKMDLQESLIYDQQKAFLNYQSSTGAQLKDLAKFQDAVSRLTLGNGLMRTELAHAKEASSALGLGDSMYDLHTHVVGLLAKKKDLEAEVQNHRNTVSKLEAEATTHRGTISDLEQKLADAKNQECETHEKEIRSLKDNLSAVTEKLRKAEESAKTSKLNGDAAMAELNGMKTELARTKAEASGAKAEVVGLKNLQNTQQHKFNALAKEHAQAAQDRKKLANLEAENASLQQRLDDTTKEVAGLKGQAAKADELAMENQSLASAKDEVEGKFKSLCEEKEALAKAVEKLRRDNDELEEEVNELASKKAEIKKLSTRIAALEVDLANVRAATPSPQASKVPASDALANTQIESLKTQLRSAEQQVGELRMTIDRWRRLSAETLANVRVKEEEVEDLREQAKLDREMLLLEIEELKQDAKFTRTNGTSSPNGVSGWDHEQESNARAAFWKAKYDQVMAENRQNSS